MFDTTATEFLVTYRVVGETADGPVVLTNRPRSIVHPDGTMTMAISLSHARSRATFTDEEAARRIIAIASRDIVAPEQVELIAAQAA